MCIKFPSTVNGQWSLGCLNPSFLNAIFFLLAFCLLQQNMRDIHITLFNIYLDVIYLFVLLDIYLSQLHIYTSNVIFIKTW